MSAYEAGDWTDLYVAAAGASAALAGLVFVAVSINIERILALPGIADRALQTLLLLLSVVVFSLLVLTPGQSDVALGVEVAGIGVVVTVACSWLIARALKARTPDAGGGSILLDPRTLILAAGTVPSVIAGASLIAGVGGGLYWLLAGVIAAVFGGVLNAWVLLVEILR